MKRVAIAVSTVLVCWLLAWQLAAHWPTATGRSPGKDAVVPDMGNVAIAAREEALTFARYVQGDTPRLLLVNKFSDGKVSGIDLQQQFPDNPADPIALFNQVGYEALRDLAGTVVSVDVTDLLLPFSGTDNQVAVGINYRTHADETSVAESFLFPKRTAATSFQSSVMAADHLLDYEIELGFVLLRDLPRGMQPQYIGLVLASDYTDRAALLRHANLADVSSGDGFTTGKSAPGFMSVGNLLVIPKDYLRFYPALQLELWLNGEKRQSAAPAQMIWDFPRIVAETFAQEQRRWQWRETTASLPVGRNGIVERTVFLSGTPGGVIYRKPSIRQLFIGLSEAFFTLQWLNPQSVVEPFLREEYLSGRYLAPGDIVQMRADRLGTISNTIR
jgi:2,4-didehydro-3-deoxy-L-rhamnonate hydrolase